MSNKPSENDDLEKEKMGGSYQVSTREDFPLPSNANNFCVESDLDCRYPGPYILFPFTIQQKEHLSEYLGSLNGCKWTVKWIWIWHSLQCSRLPAARSYPQRPRHSHSQSVTPTISPISLPILESFLTILTLSQVWLRKGVHNDLISPLPLHPPSVTPCPPQEPTSPAVSKNLPRCFNPPETCHHHSGRSDSPTSPPMSSSLAGLSSFTS